MIVDRAWKVAEKDLEGLSQRFQAVGSNLANANTPGYGRKEVSFEEELRSVVLGPDKLPLKVTQPSHIVSVPATVDKVVPSEKRIYDEKVRFDGNNVDLEIEMAKMMETRLAYQSMTRLIGKKSSMYRLVIGGR
ncbi:MAG: flagellar basal body rod protein FlgB [Aminobacterium sp.]|uniref:flagellar basal body rod protein FlgB n=1 Tax=unclassified Aminobacterium TaxID=2685012 RepID=UPI001BCE9327|nr:MULTISPECIES: flagellar basal body rod protein FlgB [unclassified Aminobacterium]MDD2207059.1 flagellar basal body rod protein FlgB [Aminobacterium sp.]MDD3425587.1 flagellar basal body rod protein FlgB [Aminobacterium sp.]MDD3707420.1 flagellar basal body rod protein FlgB [Aminobacterium sp.]MDD4228762.1 flagellar basal body rod protein FlgB [Aminobacterium sp.]MDD4550619.1 flagellar basal body rod protein FlgB [Aminobacterium sp.]